MIEHYLQLDGARVVATAPFAIALENARGVLRRRAISLFWGDPGLGKSVAARAVEQRHGAERIAHLKLTTRPNPRLLANWITRALTGVEHDETRWQAAETLKLVLTERDDWLIVIDEAQNLSLECIEWLRWLHEELPGTFALLLVGGPQVGPRLARSPQLLRRIFQPTPFRRLDESSVVDAMRFFHPIYEGADEELIIAADRRHCHGNFGSWAQVSVTAFESCRERGIDTVDDEILDLAIRRNSGLVDALRV